MARVFSVKEMHVEVEQALQRQGAYKRDKIYPEEVDWRLQMAEDRVIKYRVKPDRENENRFQIDSKYLADIQPILVSNYKLPIIQEGGENYYGLLPYNFKYLTSDRSRVLQDCDPAWKTKTATVTGRLISYQLGDATGNAPYYKNISVAVGNVAKSFNSPGFASKAQKYEIVEVILKLLAQQGFEGYWMQYNDQYAPDTIFVYTTSVNTPVITIDNTNLVNSSVSYPLVFVNSAYGRESINRNVRADFKWELLYVNHYTKTKPHSPVTSLSQNRLYAHVDKSFLVSQLLIDYIRTPRKISLTLNQTSELVSLHEEICSVAVEMILNDVEGTNYRNKVESNINRLE